MELDKPNTDVNSLVPRVEYRRVRRLRHPSLGRRLLHSWRRIPAKYRLLIFQLLLAVAVSMGAIAIALMIVRFY